MLKNCKTVICLNRSKLILALMLCIAALGILALPITANAETDGYYTYTVTDGKATITDCDTKISGDVTIPDTLGGYPVTSIGSNAFRSCSSLTSITIPDGVTNIEAYAFSHCERLTSTAFPDGVTNIGYGVFENCTRLTSILIPDSVTSIGGYAFYWCHKLTNITIPDGVTYIGDSAFNKCYSLTNITIPDGVRYIGPYAFSGCSDLTSITIPDSVRSIESYAFSSCYGLESITIPDSVTSIGNGVFGSCSSLTSITIPNSVTKIGDYAFWYCKSLTDITIPESVTSIGKQAFYECRRLTSITISDSVTHIGYYAFDYCSRLTDVYYIGSEEDWKNIYIAPYNGYFIKATRHYNHGNTSVYEPSTDIDINVESDPSYMPSAINKVTINGKGTAYGRFKILNSDGTVAKNKKVHYSIDGDMERTENTDEYGYAVIEIPYITKSKDYTVTFSGSGIQPFSGILSVTVEPLHFKTGYDLSIEKGASVGAGLEVGAEFGNLKAKAGVASVGLDGSVKNSLSFEQEFANNKNKLTISSKTNYSVAAEAKAGLFANAKAENIAGVNVSLAELSGKAGIGGIIGVSFEDEDFKLNDAQDIENLSRFMLSAFIGTQFGNVGTKYIADALNAPINAYEKGSVITLKGGASAGTIEVGTNNIKAGVTLAGIDANSVWTNTTKTLSDSSLKYSSEITGGFGTKLLNTKLKFSDGSTSLGSMSDFINDNIQISAEKDKDGNLKKLSFSSKKSGDDGSFLYKKTETDAKKITYTNDASENVAKSYDELNKFVTGNKAYFNISQMKKALEAMTNSKESATYARTKKVKEALSLDLSASVKLLVKIGGKIGVSGSSSYEYDTKTGIYENGTVYVQAENDIGDDVDNMAITFDDIKEMTKNTIDNILNSLWETAKGLADQAVEYGQALVEKATDTVTGWAVSITKAISPIKSMSILAVEDEVSLFSTSSLATTIGEPYIISVEDEDGNEVTDFSANPFVLTLTYTEAQLAEAGVTDLNTVSIVRWDDEKGAYVKLGGTLDTENSCMTLEILKPGQYILAVDNCPPAITQFVASGNGMNPEISAIVSDMSGIADFKLSIDGEAVLDSSNFEEYYNYTTGEFKYQTEGLTEGEHTATIYAADTFGNEIEEEITFTVDTAIPEILNVTEISKIISGDVTVSADVSSSNLMSVLLNAEITDIYGNVVKNSVDMIETDGKYTATLPNIENGYSVNIWVSAYSASGNKAESEKQQAVVIKSEDNLPMITVTKIENNNVTVMCTGIDGIENAKIYLAAYDSAGKLIQIKTSDLAESKTFEGISPADNIKAFIWDGLKPLCKSTTVKY